MTRRQLGLTGALLARVARAADRPPNLLFVLTDDQRHDTLGCTGNRIIRTPVIDRLAGNGVVFENNFVTTAICAVSRASIFTGLHVRSHGVDNFQKPLQDADRPLAYYNLLRKAGYRTGFVGKYGVGTQMPAGDFDVWRGFPGQGKYENKMDGRTVHLHEIQTSQCLEFLDGCSAAQPFCLSLSTKAPHADDPEPRQFIAEPDFASMYDDVRIPRPHMSDQEAYDKLPAFLKTTEMRKRWAKRFTSDEQFQTMTKNYYRLISGVDRMLGRMLERLESKGLLNNTVVVWSSDNGFFLGERGMADKWMMYEPSIRTPLVMWDGRTPNARARRVREMTLNIDVAPTLLDYASVDRPVHLQGRSLRPLVEGRLWKPRSEWYYEHHYTQGVVIPRCEGIRNMDWKYIRYIDPQPEYEELFNMRRDPDESDNVLPRVPDVAARLRERRLRWLAAFDGWQRGEPWNDPA